MSWSLVDTGQHIIFNCLSLIRVPFTSQTISCCNRHETAKNPFLFLPETPCLFRKTVSIFTLPVCCCVIIATSVNPLVKKFVIYERNKSLQEDLQNTQKWPTFYVVFLADSAAVMQTSLKREFVCPREPWEFSTKRFKLCLVLVTSFVLAIPISLDPTYRLIAPTSQ